MKATIVRVLNDCNKFRSKTRVGWRIQLWRFPFLLTPFHHNVVNPQIVVQMPRECMWSNLLMVSFKIPSQVGWSSFFFLIRLDKVTLLSLWPWNFVMRCWSSLLVTIPKGIRIPHWSSRWLIIFCHAKCPSSCSHDHVVMTTIMTFQLQILWCQLRPPYKLRSNFQKYHSPKTFPISQVRRDLSFLCGNVQLVS